MQKHCSWQAAGAAVSKHERVAQLAKALVAGLEVGEGSAFGAAGQSSVYVGGLRDLVCLEQEKETTAEEHDSEVNTEKGDGKEETTKTPQQEQ